MRISSKHYLAMTSQLSTDAESSQTELFAKLGAKKCFKDADRNRDRVITQDEITLSEEAFAKLDASKDGKISAEEMTSTLSGHGKEIQTFYSGKRRTGSSRDLLATILGESTSPEQTAAIEKTAKQYLASKDGNKDGVLSAHEANLSASAFTKVDANANGTIEQSEMHAALKNHGAKLAAYFKAASSSTSGSSKKG